MNENELGSIPTTLFSCLFFASLALTNPLHATEIAFFYTLEEDIAAFEKVAGKPSRVSPVGDTPVRVYESGGHRAVAAKMGSGCVRTATSVQATLARFPVQFVVSVGPAGGLAEDLNAGSWTWIREAKAYQRGTHGVAGFTAAKEAAFSVGEIPPILEGLLASFAVADPEDAGKKIEAAKAGDSVLRDVVAASGEVFVASGQQRETLRNETKADVVEMNLFGLLTVQKAHRLPGLHLRVVSDRADDNASESFAQFVKSYDGRGGTLVGEWFLSLPEDRTAPKSFDGLRRIIDGKEE
ncbi:MAG: hypothetical protein AAGA58_01680 [Verrucomicrobiota bacterium]